MAYPCALTDVYLCKVKSLFFSNTFRQAPSTEGKGSDERILKALYEHGPILLEDIVPGKL